MKMARVLCGFYLLLAGLLAIHPVGTSLAQEDKTIEEKIELRATYPKLEAIAGENFVFEVEFKYTGEEARDFDLRTTLPKGWKAYMTPPYEKDKKVASVGLERSFGFGNKLRVVVTAPFWPLPEPGEYKITLEAVSEELKGSLELKAVITARHSLLVVSANERYNTTAAAGKDNYFSLEVGNFGTAAVNNVTFSTDKPEGWLIEFTPEKIETLEAWVTPQTVDVNIKPPAETIAGDYMVTIRASGKQATAEKIDIRVEVETSTVWGWVGVGIILVVIAGLVVIFMRFSRR